jgi:hypothetical protein
MWGGGAMFIRQVAGCFIMRKFLICLSARTLKISPHFRSRFTTEPACTVFFARNIFYPYFVNRFERDHDFLFFLPYLDKVTRVSWPSFPSICLLPSDGPGFHGFRVLSHWQTRLYHKHGNQSVAQHSVINQNIFINWERTPSQFCHSHRNCCVTILFHFDSA